MSADKLDDLAKRTAVALVDGISVSKVRAALDEAVAEERARLRETVLEIRAAKLFDDEQACNAMLAALAAREAKRETKRPETLMPRNWKHTEKCNRGVSKDKCICWSPIAAREAKP